MAQGTENRRSLCPLTCVPRPRVNLPPVFAWIFHADVATIIGLRGKATAIAVRSAMRWVARPAIAMVMKGSFSISGVAKQSNPMLSAAWAAEATVLHEAWRGEKASTLTIGFLRRCAADRSKCRLGILCRITSSSAT